MGKFKDEAGGKPIIEFIGLKSKMYRGILVYNICLISISNSVFDGATNKSVLNTERS